MADTSNRWTPAQEQAITTGGANILVAAAAGAGKTATLVERCIRRITDPYNPIDVDRLLVVTFTDAAAAEMRQRLGEALHAAVSANPGSHRLQSQLALLGRASISTLHGFCLELVRRNFYHLGLDPALSVMDEHEADLLREEVLTELLTHQFGADPESPFFNLIDHYGGGRNHEKLKLLLLALYDYANSLPWPDQWLSEVVKAFDLPAHTPIEKTAWWEPIKRGIILSLGQAATNLQLAADLARRPGGPAQYSQVINNEIGQVEALLAAIDQPDATWAAAAAVGNLTFDSLPRVKNDTADDDLKKRVQDARNDAKRKLTAIAKTYFCRTQDSWLEELNSLAPLIQTLVGLVQAFAETFQKAKARQSGVDFNDLERFALRLLLDPGATAADPKPSPIALGLRQRYAEVLIDEYQDINGVQDMLLTLVSRDGTAGAPNRFMVGDVKQSIYRFRHAEPSLFLEKYFRYAPQPAAEGRRIILGANFRSRQGIVDAVNYVFRRVMTATVGGLDYDSDSELVCRADYPPLPGGAAEPAVMFHLIDSPAAAANYSEAEDGEVTPAGAGGAELADLTAREREARLVAALVHNMIRGTDVSPPVQVWDKALQQYRPAEYRDVAVLLRATKNKANIFLEAFTALTIPAYADLTTGYFAATEIAVMLSLLQIIDNPHQDIPLAAVLRSPIVGLKAADLAAVRQASPGGSFFEAVTAAAANAATGPAAVLQQFLVALDSWRTKIRHMPLSDVLWILFRDTGYSNYVQGMPNGRRRHANLLALYDRARQFDQFARQGLSRFLKFISGLRQANKDLGTAPVMGEGEDAVRVMSIHKSKGLEFPIVILADLAGKFGRQDEQGDLLLHRILGLGPLVINPALGIKYETIAFRAVKESIRFDNLAEEMRVLYVAMTRARERLILVGSGPALPQQLGSPALAASYLDWLLPAVMDHPDGLPLWDAAGAAPPSPATSAGDPSRWDVRVWNGTEPELLAPIPRPEAVFALPWPEMAALQPLGRVSTSAVPAAMAERFGWKYRFAPLVNRFAKLSVTELQAQWAAPDPEAEPWLPSLPHYTPAIPRLERRPKFMQAGRRTLTPGEFGTLMHLVLQHLDLARALDVPDIHLQLKELVQKGLVGAEHEAAVDVPAIAGFFASELGRRIRAQREFVQREVSFTLALPATAVYPNIQFDTDQTESADPVLIQGMIDLLLEQPDGFVIIDYKTDRREPEEGAAQYRTQVGLYRRAVEEIRGKPASEVYLHFLTAGRTVEM